MCRRDATVTRRSEPGGGGSATDDRRREALETARSEPRRDGCGRSRAPGHRTGRPAGPGRPGRTVLRRQRSIRSSNTPPFERADVGTQALSRRRSPSPHVQSATPMGRSDPSRRSFAAKTSPHARHLATNFESDSVFDISTDVRGGGMAIPPMIFGVTVPPAVRRRAGDPAGTSPSHRTGPP